MAVSSEQNGRGIELIMLGRGSGGSDREAWAGDAGSGVGQGRVEVCTVFGMRDGGDGVEGVW